MLYFITLGIKLPVSSLGRAACMNTNYGVMLQICVHWYFKKRGQKLVEFLGTQGDAGERSAFCDEQADIEAQINGSLTARSIYSVGEIQIPRIA